MKTGVIIAAGVIFALALLALPAFSGTLIFKDGSVLTNVEIVGINDGAIIVEKDKTKKNFPLKDVKTYSKSDLSIAENSSPDDTIDYKVTLYKIDMPDTGKSKEKDSPEQCCEINYTISKSQGKTKKIRTPYFYLYVLTSQKDDNEGRKVYRFCSPDKAKPKGKDYDPAAIIEKVNSFDRPELEDQEDINIDTKLKLAGRTVKFSLSSIGERKILAYHIEVWGKTDKVAEKTEKKINNANPSSISDNWWQKL